MTLCAIQATEGEWSHWAYVLDAVAGSVFFYRDGVQVFQQDGVVAGGPIGTRGIVHMGMYASALGADYDPYTFLDGAIDEVRVWDGPRSPADVARYMRRSSIGARGRRGRCAPHVV